MDKTEFIIAIIGIIINIGIIVTALFILFYQQYKQGRKERNRVHRIPILLSFNICKAIGRGSEYSVNVLKLYYRELPLIGMVLIHERFTTYKGNWVEFNWAGGKIKHSVNNAKNDATVIIEDVREIIDGRMG